MIKDSTIIVTGSDSMIGRALCQKLLLLGSYVYKLPHRHFNLLDYNLTRDVFHQINADYVFHLAGYNGNLVFNSKYPADIFYRTSQLGLNVLKASQQTGISKVCSLISSCAYSPDFPLEESLFFQGSPHESVEAHGFAKKMLVQYGRQLKKQHGMDCINICVNHVYGPYDSFDPYKTKVMGSLIKKFSDAKKNSAEYVELWGQGNAFREFIYVDDVAKYLPMAFERYNDSFEILNIASGEEISIKDLAGLVKKATGFEGEIKWSGSDDGQARKLLDNRKMKDTLGNLEFTPIEEGIQKTLDWYENFVYSSN